MNIRKKDFLIYADGSDISRNSAEQMMSKLVSMKPIFIAMCKESLLPQDLKKHMIALIEERSSIFEV